MLWRWRDDQMTSNDWNRMLGRHDSANFRQPFFFHPVVIFLRAITVSGFNQYSATFPYFEAKIASNCKRVSQYRSLEVVFCKFNKNLTKGSIFQWTALGFVCPHWNYLFKVKLEISEFRSTSVGQSWAVQLLRIAPCTEPFSGATFGQSSNLPVQISRHQHGICGSMFLPSVWGMWIVMHMIRFTLRVFHLYLYYGIIFMTTARRSVLLTQGKQIVTLSELI